MKKSYCTNPTIEDCSHCTLSSYGRDCKNNPLPIANTPLTKIEQAQKFSKIGILGDTFRAALDVIPGEILSLLTANETACLIDSIVESWSRTKAMHEKDIIAEGMIYDIDKNVVLELSEAR